MLHEFLKSNRTELIARARAKVETRRAPRPTDEELTNGIPLFLDQLAEALRLERLGSEAMETSATKHGADLLRMGFTIAQVVHDYGDVCQAVTELAEETRARITVDEFHILNKCLDNAIAGAVTEFTRLRQVSQNQDEISRLGVFAHELRNRLSATTLAFESLKAGRVGLEGSTGAMIDRNLSALRDLIDKELADVRLASEKPGPGLPVSVFELVEEVELYASLEAGAHGVTFAAMPSERGLMVSGDRAIILAALINVAQNAIKFTRPGGAISIRTSATPESVMFEVEDECGGLAEGAEADMFDRFTQRRTSHKGLGLGLSIVKRGIEASAGSVGVRDLPGKGCVFTITLPRSDVVRLEPQQVMTA